MFWGIRAWSGNHLLSFHICMVVGKCFCAVLGFVEEAPQSRCFDLSIYQHAVGDLSALDQCRPCRSMSHNCLM